MLEIHGNIITADIRSHGDDRCLAVVLSYKMCGGHTILSKQSATVLTYGNHYLQGWAL